jgi:hypothetical protein
VPGEFLVKFKTRVARSALEKTLRDAALRSKREFRSVPGLRLVTLG